MSEDFAAYRRWIAYIHDTHPELPKGIARSTLLAYCQAIARAGSSGIDCFKADSTIAKELEINHREIIANYREFAIKIGWFVPNGRRDGRVIGLNIAIPADAPNGAPADDGKSTASGDVAAPAPNGEPETDAEHIGSTLFDGCPGCVPYMDAVRGGKMSSTELARIHDESRQRLSQ